MRSEKFLAQVTRLFYEHDRDKSGYLDYAEVRALIETLHLKMARAGFAVPRPNADTFQRKILTIDANRDNWVSMKELVPFVQDWFIELAIFKETLAKQPAWLKDDPLSDDEAPTVHILNDWKFSLRGGDLRRIKLHVNSEAFRQQAHALFVQFDKDRSGWLSHTEAKPIASKVADVLRREGLDVP